MNKRENEAAREGSKARQQGKAARDTHRDGGPKDRMLSSCSAVEELIMKKLTQSRSSPVLNSTNQWVHTAVVSGCTPTTRVFFHQNGAHVTSCSFQRGPRTCESGPASLALQSELPSLQVFPSGATARRSQGRRRTKWQTPPRKHHSFFCSLHFASQTAAPSESSPRLFHRGPEASYHLRSEIQPVASAVMARSGFKVSMIRSRSPGESDGSNSSGTLAAGDIEKPAAKEAAADSG